MDRRQRLIVPINQSKLNNVPIQTDVVMSPFLSPSTHGVDTTRRVAKIPGVWMLLAVWRHRAVSRQRLSRLEPHMLKDIGVTPEEARSEALRPFWKH